jgi:hypothetical protein
MRPPERIYNRLGLGNQDGEKAHEPIGKDAGRDAIAPAGKITIEEERKLLKLDRGAVRDEPFAGRLGTIMALGSGVLVLLVLAT